MHIINYACITIYWNKAAEQLPDSLPSGFIDKDDSSGIPFKKYKKHILRL